jgi:hypothetical protein
MSSRHFPDAIAHEQHQLAVAKSALGSISMAA